MMTKSSMLMELSMLTKLAMMSKRAVYIWWPLGSFIVTGAEILLPLTEQLQQQDCAEHVHDRHDRLVILIVSIFLATTQSGSLIDCIQEFNCNIQVYTPVDLIIKSQIANDG